MCIRLLKQLGTIVNSHHAKSPAYPDMYGLQNPDIWAEISRNNVVKPPKPSRESTDQRPQEMVTSI